MYVECESPSSQADSSWIFSRMVNLSGCVFMIKNLSQHLVSFDQHHLPLNRWPIAVYCGFLCYSCLSVYLSVYHCFHEFNLIVNNSPAQLSPQAIILLRWLTIYNWKVYKHYYLFSEINDWFQNCKQLKLKERGNKWYKFI